MDKDFLVELLKTPSPSGWEMNIQKKWRAYVEKFSHEVRTDTAGNVYAILNPEAEFKILVAAHCDEIGFLVTRIDPDGFVYFTKLGAINAKLAVGRKVEILGYNKKITGVIGVNAEHHGGVADGVAVENLYIDCGFSSVDEAKSFIQVGDPIIYKTKYEFLENDLISSRALDNKTGIFILAEVLKKLSEENPQVGIYAVSTVNEETNRGGAYFAGARIEPDMCITCDVTFATDYPEEDEAKYGDIKLNKGPVLAKGSPVNHKINSLFENTAKKLGIGLQYEITPRYTGTDADKIRMTGKGVPIALLSLPIRYMHSPIEVASFKDVEAEIKLLFEVLKNIDSKFNLNILD